jgi:hypothetical protein
MIRRTENRIKHIAASTLIALSFLFSAHSIKHTNKQASLSFQHQIASLQTIALPLNDIQEPLIQQISASLINEINFKLTNQFFNILTTNRLMNHKIMILQRLGLFIKPITPVRFYYQCIYIDPDALPILS